LLIKYIKENIKTAIKAIKNKNKLQNPAKSWFPLIEVL
jgi:HEAT repeat protein